MMRVADRPAALAIANLHEPDGRRSEKRLPIIALLLIARILAAGVLPLDQSGIGRGLHVRVLRFGHPISSSFRWSNIISRRCAMRPSDNTSMLRRPRENWLKSQGGKKTASAFPRILDFCPSAGIRGERRSTVRPIGKAGLGSHIVYC